MRLPARVGKSLRTALPHGAKGTTKSTGHGYGLSGGSFCCPLSWC